MDVPQYTQELSTQTEIPQGLKPGSPDAVCGAAKAAPLQDYGRNRFAFHWRRWALIPLAIGAIACAVPWLLAHSPELGLALRRGFSLVCHQQPERSFFLFGGSVAVCARCLGIYLGAAAGLLLRVPRKLAWRSFLLALALNTFDRLAEIGGIHGNWMSLRYGMGFALGWAGAMLVIASAGKVKIPTQAKEA